MHSGSNCPFTTPNRPPEHVITSTYDWIGMKQELRFTGITWKVNVAW